MFFAAVCSVFFLTASLTHQPVQVLREFHLETANGRAAFLTNDLTPYAAKAAELNDETIALARIIETLSPDTDQQQILDLTTELTQKMDTLSKVLPTLQLALSVHDDFQQIDSILDQTTPLSSEQQQVVDRIADLYSAVNFH